MSDELSYDIFAQAAQAIRSPGSVNVVEGNPLAPIFDAVVLHGGGGRIRTDLEPLKVWKLLSETDVLNGQAANRQPDTNAFRTWEVAGDSHVDLQFVTYSRRLSQRDGSSVGPPVVITRDAAGNALGSIRLSQHAVPTAVNTGQNSGPGFCRLNGSYEAFPPEKIASLYPTHAGYVAAVRAATESNLKAGYILRPEADATIAEAEQSRVGLRP